MIIVKTNISKTHLRKDRRTLVSSHTLTVFFKFPSFDLKSNSALGNNYPSIDYYKKLSMLRWSNKITSRGIIQYGQ